MAKTFFKVEGIKQLQKSLDKLGKVPQRHVTASAKKGMNIVLKDAKANAPYDTGMLKKGIIMRPERSSFKGKKVLRIVFDSSMNDIFQKPNKEGKITGYYPISQEYGFFTRNGRYIPGYRFLHDSLNDNAKAMEKIIISTMKKKIDEEIRKAGLG